jgi:hypothetical protein
MFDLVYVRIAHTHQACFQLCLLYQMEKAETEAAARALKLPDKVTLLNADSMKLEEDIPDEIIKDNSVDLIVTDPPYLKDLT